MVWSTPQSATVAGIISGSFWNTQWTENIKSLGLASIQDGELLIGVSPGVVKLVSAASQALRPGVLYRFPDTGTVPADYLNCDGSLVSRTTYADLFAVVGTELGSGVATSLHGQRQR